MTDQALSQNGQEDSQALREAHSFLEKHCFLGALVGHYTEFKAESNIITKEQFIEKEIQICLNIWNIYMNIYICSQ